jgi:hypothetical protein
MAGPSPVYGLVLLEPLVYDCPMVADAPPGGVAKPVLFVVLDVRVRGVSIEVGFAPVVRDVV